MNKRSDFQGLEFDWFATDADGFVAFISSAGYGPIPDRVFEQFDEQRRIEEFLHNLIGVCMSDDLCRVEQLLSAAGVFAYDWRRSEGRYRRSNMPIRPKSFDELGVPSDLRNTFVAVPGHFITSAELRPELFPTCTT